MRPDIPRLLPIWFLPFLLLIAFLLMGQCGCRTGGSWVSGGSGVKQVIIPSDLEKQPNGTFKLKPKDIGIPPGNPVQVKPSEVKSTPIKLESAITKPTPLKPVSAKPEKSLPANIKAAESKTPFKPTITTTPKLEEKVNVKPIKNPPAKVVTNPVDPVTPIEPKKEAAVTVKWMELFVFYFLAIMLILFIWIVYDIRKEYKKITPKKQKLAVKKQRRGRPKGSKNKKKPTTKKKSSR